MLVRLMYASRAVASVPQDEMLAIVRKSKTNNAEHGITGVLCLCFAQGIYLQVLEGGRSAVNRLYNTIVADKRHQQVELLSYEEINQRRFSGWSMGQVNMARLNPSLVLKYSETVALDPYAVPGQMSMALFDDLVATASIVGQS